MQDAWPFLIGRTRSDDHRIVVIPAFMTDAPWASALRSGTDGEPGPAVTARLRELRVPGHDALTAVYRIFLLDAADFGLPGHGLLTDRVGRPIAVTEGFVVRGPANAVTDMGVTAAHLHRARTLVTPAYQAFWAEGRSYRRRDSVPFALTPADGAVPLIALTAGRPWEPEAAPAGSAAVTAPVWGAAPAGSRVPVATAAARPAGRSRRPAAGLLRAVIVILAVIVLVWVIRMLTAGAPAATAGQTMSKLCGALRSGRPAAGYALTAASYRKGMSETGFANELLPPPDASGAQCTYQMRNTSGSGTAQASMTITPRGAAPATWAVSLAQPPGSSWQVAGLSLAPATGARRSGPGRGLAERNGPTPRATRG